MEFVKKGDKDFRTNPVLKTRDQRAVERLLAKEKREERWGKNPEIKLMLSARFYH